MHISSAVPSLSRLGALAATDGLSNGISGMTSIHQAAIRSIIDHPNLPSTTTSAIRPLAPPPSSPSTPSSSIRPTTSSLPKYTAKVFTSSTIRPQTSSRSGASPPKKSNAWEGLVPGLLGDGVHINPYDLSTLVPMPVGIVAAPAPPASSKPAATPAAPASQTQPRPVDWGADWGLLGGALPADALSSLSLLVPLNVPRPDRTALAGMADGTGLAASFSALGVPRSTKPSVAATGILVDVSSLQPQMAKTQSTKTSAAAVSFSSVSSVTMLNAPSPVKPSLAATTSPLVAVSLPSPQVAKSQPKEVAAQKGVPKLLYKFGNGTWIENLAVGPSSSLFLTLYDRPELYRYDPQAPEKKPVLVRHFAEEGRLSGITETTANEYAVLLSRKVPTGKSLTEIWAVRCDDECDGKLQYSRKTGKLNVEWIGGPYPEVEPLNGMTTAGPGVVLASDPLKGRIYGFVLPGTTASVVLSEARLLSPGITGIRLLGNTLYFANMLSGVFARVKVDLSRAVAPLSNSRPTSEAGFTVMNIAASSVEIIAKGLVGVNDFAVSLQEEAAYIADYGGNALLKANLKDGTVSKFAHIPGGPTSAQFGRRLEDANVLYVTTSSGALYSVSV